MMRKATTWTFFVCPDITRRIWTRWSFLMDSLWTGEQHKGGYSHPCVLIVECTWMHLLLKSEQSFLHEVNLNNGFGRQECSSVRRIGDYFNFRPKKKEALVPSRKSQRWSSIYQSIQVALGLSELTLGERQGTPWTGCQSINCHLQIPALVS